MKRQLRSQQMTRGRRVVEPRQAPSRRGAVRRRVRRPLRERLAALQSLVRAITINVRLLFMVVMMLSVGVATWYGMQGLDRLLSEPVNHVAIEGRLEHADRQKVAQLINDAIVRGFWRSDLTHLKRQLETVPWIRHAHIRRQWPDHLVITLTEQVAIAYWQERALLNDQGDVFAPGKLPQLPIPHLSGPDGSEDSVLQDFRDLSQQFDKLGMQLAVFSVDAKGSRRVVLDNGIEIALGDGDMAAKLARLDKIFAAQLAGRSEQIARIDMRYTNGLAVRWRDQLPHVLADRGN